MYSKKTAVFTDEFRIAIVTTIYGLFVFFKSFSGN